MLSALISQVPPYVVFILVNSLHILSTWCLLHKMLDYVEIACALIRSTTSMHNNCFCGFFPVHDVSLSHSLVPYKGFVQITIDGKKRNVCWQRSQSYYVRRTFCRDLGYRSVYSYVNMSAPMNFKHSTFSGTINCNYDVKYLSQCSITASSSESCSGLLYVECKYQCSEASPTVQAFSCQSYTRKTINFSRNKLWQGLVDVKL